MKVDPRVTAVDRSNTRALGRCRKIECHCIGSPLLHLLPPNYHLTSRDDNSLELEIEEAVAVRNDGGFPVIY